MALWYCKNKKIIWRHLSMAIKTGLLFGSINATKQVFIEERCFPEGIDTDRVARSFAIGALAVGPVYSIFFRSIVCRNRTMITGGLQTGSLLVLGELFIHTVLEDKPLYRHDLVRLFKLFCFGAFLLGPIVAAWYKFLATRFCRGPRVLDTLKKVALDQLCFVPIFFGLHAGAEYLAYGRSIEETRILLRDNYFKILECNRGYLPFTQFLNFHFVPFDKQVLAFYFTVTLWNVLNEKQKRIDADSD